MHQSKKIPEGLPIAKMTEGSTKDSLGDQEDSPEVSDIAVQRNIKQTVVSLLEKYYRKNNKDYQLLLSEAARDVGVELSQLEAKALKAWKPKYRPLTSTEQEMLAGPCERGRVLMRRSLQTSNGKTVVYKSFKLEASSATNSSVVGIDRNELFVESEVENYTLRGPAFAEIQNFLCHRFIGAETEFAFLKVFGDVLADNISGLLCTSIESDLFGLAELHSLSPPLVTALEGTQMWILNHV